MKLIVGLGNPGVKYANTRHNAGHLFIGEFQKLKIPNGVVVKKTDSFMNSSGESVTKLIQKYETSPENLYIAHDDLDIRLGEYKIQLGHGPKDHNGLNDIYSRLGTNNFWHIRIGVDNRLLDDRSLGIDYVLQEFPKEEKIIFESVIKKICKEITLSLQ